MHSRRSTGSRVTTAAAIVFLAIAPVFAQEDFWQATSGPGGGSVEDLVQQPDGDLYAAMQNGPIYRSSDGGGIWHPLAHSATRLAALANGDLYAFDIVGTGGTDRSRDDGATWEHLDTAPANGRTVVAMPSGTLLLGTPAGLWRSSNDGASWEQTALQSGITSDFVVEGGIVYAGSGSSLLASDNEGQSWTTVTSIPNQSISAIARRPGGGWWIGTGRASYYGGSGALFRFVDGQAPELMPVYADNVTAVLVRPLGDVFVAAAGDGFSESWGVVASSANDGATWTTHMNGGFSALVLLGEDGVYAASTVIYGHLGLYPGDGIWRTSGPGTGWSPCNNGLAQATSFVLAAAPGTIYAQTGFSLAVSHDHGVSWETSGSVGGDTYGMQLAVHPLGPLFRSSVPWVASKGKSGASAASFYYWLARSLDGGKTWEQLDVPPSYYAAFRITAAGSILILSGSGVARSTTLGYTWQVETSGLPYEIYAIAPGPVSRVFASAWGYTYVSEDDGVNWRQIGSVGGNELAVSPSENRVFVHGTGPIYQLDETAGEGDWSTQPLPTLQYYGPMAADEAGTVYVASDAVWYKSLTDTEWHAIPGTPLLWGPGMAGKESILIDDAGFLFVGTGWNSVLRSRVPVGQTDPTDAGLGGHGFTITVGQPGPNPFRQQTSFGLELGAPGPVSLVLYDVRGRVVSTLLENTPLGAGRHVATWRPGPGVASGNYYYRLVAGRTMRSGRVTLIR